MTLAENVARRVGQQTIAIAGVWLRKMGDRAEVLVENPETGEWVLLISEHGESHFSHIYEPGGIAAKFGPATVNPNPVLGRCMAFGHQITDHAKNSFCDRWEPLR